MELTARVLKESIEQAQRFVKKRLPERRKGGRTAMSASVCVVPVSPHGCAEPVMGQVTTLSATGLGLILTKPLTRNTEFCLRLPTDNGGPCLWARCLVMRWQASPNGSFFVGARFSDLVCTDLGEIPQLLDPASLEWTGEHLPHRCVSQLNQIDESLRAKNTDTTPAGGANQRQSQRRRVLSNFNAWLLDHKPQPLCLRVQMMDISTGGVGFASRMPLANGTRLAFLLHFKGQAPKYVLTRALRCKRVETHCYHIGAELVDARPVAPNGKIPADWVRPDLATLSR